MAKKLQGMDAQLFKKWINQSSDTITDVDGQRYLVKVLEENIVKKEIESDPEIKKMIKKAEKDIEEGYLFSTDDIIKAIERGEI